MTPEQTKGLTKGQVVWLTCIRVREGDFGVTCCKVDRVNHTGQYIFGTLNDVMSFKPLMFSSASAYTNREEAVEQITVAFRNTIGAYEKELSRLRSYQTQFEASENERDRT